MVLISRIICQIYFLKMLNIRKLICTFLSFWLQVWHRFPWWSGATDSRFTAWTWISFQRFFPKYLRIDFDFQFNTIDIVKFGRFQKRFSAGENIFIEDISFRFDENFFTFDESFFRFVENFFRFGNIFFVRVRVVHGGQGSLLFAAIAQIFWYVFRFC